MAQKQVAVEIRGGAPHGSPLLMHAYRGEKPTQTKPRIKTQEWLDEQRKQMWFEALYHDGQGCYIPSENLERMLVDGARRFLRKGEDFKESVYVGGVVNRLILYPSDSLNAEGKEAIGPPEKWWDLPQHRDLRGVVTKNGRIDCMRPIFRQWGCKFTIVFESSIVTLAEIEKAMERGKVGAYRPRFGRFIVTGFEEVGNGDGKSL